MTMWSLLGNEINTLTSHGLDWKNTFLRTLFVPCNPPRLQWMQVWKNFTTHLRSRRIIKPTINEKAQVSWQKHDNSTTDTALTKSKSKLIERHTTWFWDTDPNKLLIKTFHDKQKSNKILKRSFLDSCSHAVNLFWASGCSKSCDQIQIQKVWSQKGHSLAPS